VVVPTVGIETFGRVAAESLAKGTPAIVSNLGGLPEIIDDGATGFHTRPGSPLDLADHVRWMIEHPSDGLAMRHRARAAYLERFVGERVLEMWLSAYHSAIAAHQNSH